MRALTICQPYAHLIVTQQAELPIGAVPKRVENRTWETRYRGLLLIHAGKSMKFLHGDDRTKYPEMKFGAIIGIAHLIDCVRATYVSPGRNSARNSAMNFQCVFSKEVELKHPWLKTHFHTEGPWCWVLAFARRIKPIPCKGAQGLWIPPEDIQGQVRPHL